MAIGVELPNDTGLNSVPVYYRAAFRQALWWLKTAVLQDFISVPTKVTLRLTGDSQVVGLDLDHGPFLLNSP